MGRQHGEVLKGRFVPPPASERKIEFAERCEEMVAEHAPGLLDELRGVADAGRVDLQLLKAFVLVLGVEPRCTVFAVSGDHAADGAPLFARNYDWDESFQQYFTAAWAKPSGGLSSLSFTDHMVGRYGGVNEAGLAVAITLIPAYNRRPTPGVRVNLATRWVLDTCRTTEQAASYLEEIPHQIGQNLLLADRDGVIARVETSGEKTVVDFADEGFSATTNHYLSPEMKHLESEDRPLESSRRRLANVLSWFGGREGLVGVDDVRFVLSDHDRGVCNHGEHEGARFGTIWSWIAPLDRRLVYLCDGPPCKNEYKAVRY